MFFFNFCGETGGIEGVTFDMDSLSYRNFEGGIIIYIIISLRSPCVYLDAGSLEALDRLKSLIISKSDQIPEINIFNFFPISPQ